MGRHHPDVWRYGVASLAYGADTTFVATAMIAVSYGPTALIAAYIYARLSARYAALAAVLGVFAASVSTAITIGLETGFRGRSADPLGSCMAPLLGSTSGYALFPIVRAVIRAQAAALKASAGPAP